MKKNLLFILGIILFTNNTYAQTVYPNNEDGLYEDMLTPAYYFAGNDDPFRKEINQYIHFAQLESFQHPFEDTNGQAPIFTINRNFGDGIGLGGTAQHHPAIDMHLLNGHTDVNMYAAYDGYVNTYYDAPKYRHYLSITKNVEDSIGSVIGKMVTIYAHIDLDLDESEGIDLNGQFVQQGDIISKHLYAETTGGPHLHFEIRYYKLNDLGEEDFYGFGGGVGNDDLTDMSTGSWAYGFWNPNVGYGFGHPENHFYDMNVSISENSDFPKRVNVFPNPAGNFVSIIDESKRKERFKMTIIDVGGHQIAQAYFMDKIQLSTKKFPTGLYFIHLVNEKESITRKLIINK